jgi:hypothetical protein
MTSPSLVCGRGLLVLLALSAGCGDSVDSRTASWSYVSGAIIEPNCATVSCHSRAAAVSGLDFSSPDRGYTSLTALWVWIVDPQGTAENGCRSINGTMVCQREHRPLVVPFDPQQSRLIHMLRAANAPRMPPDRPLAAADIGLIETWIANGARRNGETDGDRWMISPEAADGGVDAMAASSLDGGVVDDAGDAPGATPTSVGDADGAAGP